MSKNIFNIKQSKKISVLCVGHITCDLYSNNIIPGGSAYYGALVFNELNTKVSIATSIGKDFKFFYKLKKFKIFNTGSNSTTTFENTYPKHKPRLMLIDSPANSVNVDTVPKKFKSPDILFLFPFSGEV